MRTHDGREPGGPRPFALMAGRAARPLHRGGRGTVAAAAGRRYGVSTISSTFAQSIRSTQAMPASLSGAVTVRSTLPS